jgi:transcriptional regulator with PAS, ATPase and Fis domain
MDLKSEIIGSTPSVRQILDMVRKIGPTDSTVLITGETGVGKELIARAVHMSSRRKANPFVKVNCAAIPETLIESELFGYEKGAFTGAVINKPGRFEIADRGTLFLDEIGEIPPHLQVKLLTVLQDKAFERVGGVKTIKVDMRIVAATNMDLKGAVESGQFRSDLFYRLNVVPIHIPPLRERRDDISSQVEYFLNRFCTKYGKGTLRISPEIMPALISYNWPGNIRELENVMERMVLMSEGEEIGYEQLPAEIQGIEPATDTHTLKGTVDSIYRSTERQLIEDALKKTDQNRTKAAKLLGISRRTLQNKIKEYDL